MRSIVVPTIASDTAQNTNWKKNLAGTAACENSISRERARVRRAEDALGARDQPAPPKASANPTAQ